jgi:hypothetical protein
MSGFGPGLAFDLAGFFLAIGGILAALSESSCIENSGALTSAEPMPCDPNILLHPAENADSLAATAVVAKLVNARDLEFRNTISVLRVQVPFTANPTQFTQSAMAEDGATSESGNRFRETLPAQCPPDDASEIRSDLIVFRLVSGTIVSGNDFRSQRELQPHAQFRVSECIARGVSVFTTTGAAQNAKLLPKLRNSFICRVRLSSGAGCIKPTGRDICHRTWWPYADYDIPSKCEVVS